MCNQLTSRYEGQLIFTSEHISPIQNVPLVRPHDTHNFSLRTDGKRPIVTTLRGTGIACIPFQDQESAFVVVPYDSSVHRVSCSKPRHLRIHRLSGRSRRSGVPLSSTMLHQYSCLTPTLCENCMVG